MPLSMTPGSSIIASPELRCRHRLRRVLNGSAFRNPFHAGHVFRGFPIHAFATACQVARSPVRIRPICSALGSFYFQAFNGSVCLSVSGYDYNSDCTPLLAGLPPARMAASLAAPDPYLQLSRIRFPPRVSTATLRRMQASTWGTHTRYCARCVLCWSAIPLGLRPWLHRLRSGLLRRGLLRNGMLHFVRRLHSYYGRARLLVPVHHRLRLLVFPMRTVPRTRR